MLRPEVSVIYYREKNIRGSDIENFELFTKLYMIFGRFLKIRGSPLDPKCLTPPVFKKME
jgi:hypothetical protein